MSMVSDKNGYVKSARELALINILRALIALARFAVSDEDSSVSFCLFFVQIRIA